MYIVNPCYIKFVMTYDVIHFFGTLSEASAQPPRDMNMRCYDSVNNSQPLALTHLTIVIHLNMIQ